jgi:glycogen phosphorylase
MMNILRTVAYFSMEIALEEGMPTYSGGLGVLAGDTIRSATSLQVPMVAVTLLHRKGYFFQRLDESGWQREETADWVIENFLKERPERATVTIEGRTVQIRAWEYKVNSGNGFYIPIYLLDTYLPENSEGDRTLTHYLYGGDHHYRLCQEVILGIGGVRMLQAIGYSQINRFHMNEGHASLLTLELLDESAKKRGSNTITHEDVDLVRKLCVFTTHTPVEAGHDKFPMELVNQVLGRREIYEMKEVFCCEGVLNLTFLALNLSHYVNGVAKKHGEISRLMFAKYSIDAITNGVHVPTWVSPAFQKLFGKHIPEWEKDNFSLRYALNIPKNEIWEAHLEAKKELLKYVNRATNLGMDLDCLTIGFARRAASYKRAETSII